MNTSVPALGSLARSQPDPFCPPASESSNRARDLARHEAAPALGALLVESGRLTASQATSVLLHQKMTGLRFGEAAVSLGMVGPEDVERALACQFGGPGFIAAVAAVSPALVAVSRPADPATEALRQLRNQLMLRWFDGRADRRAVAIVSPERGDGRTFVATNLAALMAMLGRPTLLVDADLEGGACHDIVRGHNGLGLSCLLAGRCGLDDAIVPTAIPNLHLLPTGPLHPCPGDLLGRPTLGELMQEAARRFEFIVIDTPASESSPDVPLVAAQAGGAVVIGRVGRTRQASISRLVGSLRPGGVTVVGSLMNQP